MSDENEPGHGNSPAAWVAVMIMLVGVHGRHPRLLVRPARLVWASAGLLVLGAIVGVVLAKLGYGVKGPRYVPKAHS